MSGARLAANLVLMGVPMLSLLSPRAVCAILLLVGAPLRLPAQATTVSLQGSISASDGSTPEGAQIEVRSRETNRARGALVDRVGTYRVLGLAPGLYDVTVRAIGYRQQRRSGVRLVFGQRAVVDFVLERGAVELEPTVIRAEQAFEVKRTDISTVVLQEEIEKLPLNTRNVLNLAAIAPGVRTFTPEGGRGIPHAGAQPAGRLTNIYVDGVEWKGTYAGIALGQPGVGSLIPQEAVREFRVFLNPYDVEYTRGASWVISAVTHRGSNTLEGSIFGFLQNHVLIAKSTFQDEKPDFYRHQVGANLRGPVIKDRFFFSASYEGHSIDNYFDVVPGRPPAAPDKWAPYAGTFRAPTRVHNGLLRLTAPVKSHTFDVVWATRHFTSESDFGRRLIGTGVMLSREGGLFTHVSLNSLLLRDTYSSSRLVNELSLQLLENNNDDYPLRPGPTFRYPSIQMGRETQPTLIDSRHIRAINKTSYTLDGPGGQHVLKSGLEVSRVRVDTYRPSRKDGLFVFATDTSTKPRLGEIAVGFNDPASTREARDINRGWVIGAYVQDEWQPIPWLTIAAGLRYDAELNMLNQKLITPNDTTLDRLFGEDFLNTGDRENDLDNLAPRIAVTWDVFRTGRTFVRAGYGVLYDRVPVFGAQDESIARGWRTYSIQNPGTTDPAALRDSIAARGVTPRPANIVLIKDRMETPRNRQWSVGLGHELSQGLALNVDYLEQRLTNAHVTVRANQAPVGQQRPLTGLFGDIFIWDDFGDARFRALLATITYDRRASRMTVAYTLGWAETEFGDFTTSDYPTAAAYTMQRSEGDERHRVVVSGFTALPFGLDISGVAIVASPRPFLALAGGDVNQNGHGSDDWPNGTRTHRRDGWDHWYRTVDLRVGRTFALRPRRLTVTAEVFNVFNSANHAEYEGDASLDYGEPVGDYARRQGQLGVRYQF
jgi:hypothetical protein